MLFSGLSLNGSDFGVVFLRLFRVARRNDAIGILGLGRPVLRKVCLLDLGLLLGNRRRRLLCIDTFGDAISSATSMPLAPNPSSPSSDRKCVSANAAPPR